MHKIGNLWARAVSSFLARQKNCRVFGFVKLALWNLFGLGLDVVVRSLGVPSSLGPWGKSAALLVCNLRCCFFLLFPFFDPSIFLKKFLNSLLHLSVIFQQHIDPDTWAHQFFSLQCPIMHANFAFYGAGNALDVEVSLKSLTAR